MMIGCSDLLNSQSNTSPTLLIILGRYAHESAATGYIIDFTFYEDPTKCDPVKGFIPLEDQIKHFSESLVALGFPANSMQPIKSYESSLMRKQKMEIRHTDWEKVTDLFTLLRQFNLEPTEVLYDFKERKYEDEDDWAIGALQDASAKAEMIAKYMGRKIKRIVNVDDDTKSASIFNQQQEVFIFSPEIEELLSKLEFMSFSNVRKGAYVLRVTFELK
jgi:hypothetical protein